MQLVREYIKERVTIEDRGHSSPCWIWQLSLNRSGYGQGLAPGAGRVDQVHRFAYKAFVGEIPAGLHIDHLCRIRACCNPEHLEPVTPAENNRRALPFMSSRHQTHCKYGHEFTDDNVRLDKRGHRRCRTCQRERHEPLAWIRRKERFAQGLVNACPEKRQTHCKAGHEMTPENTIVWSGGLRRCRACNIAWRAEKDNHMARHRMARRRMAAARNSVEGGCRKANSGQREHKFPVSDSGQADL